MTRRTKGIYQRGRRWWGDFREYHDAGGKLEPLVAPGTTLATTDHKLAVQLYAARAAALEQARRDKVMLGVSEVVGLEAFAARHLVDMAKAGHTTEDWIAYHEVALRRAVAFFGAERTLTSITARDAKAYAQHLATLPSRRWAEDGVARTLSPGTVRATLNCLSKLYRVAVSEGAALVNPVAQLLDKPRAAKREAAWLEAHECALLLEAAHTLPPMPTQRDALPAPLAYALLATYLLTGMRSAEVLGLRVGDVSLARSVIYVRPHAGRRLKTATSHRVVPLMPQLKEILSAYLFANGDAPADDALLFPSPATREIIDDWRGTLDRIAVRAGFLTPVLDPTTGKQQRDARGELRWAGRRIRSKMFRHSYASARLQTLDGGHPISLYTVSRELGHGSETMLRERYAHLGEIRHRSEHVEFRVEQHREVLADRLEALR